VKIQKIETFPIKLKFKEPFVIASVVNYDLYYVIVRLTTDNGFIGYGEAIPAWEVTGETQLGVIDAINHFCEPRKTGFSLLGADISTFPQTLQILDRLSPGADLPVIWGAPSAKAALEEAVLDAYGKYVQSPVYALFGGVNTKIPNNHAISIYPVDETLAKVEKELRKGVRVLKLKVGMKQVGTLDNYERDIQVIKAAREMVNRLDPAVTLVADANQGYLTPDRAISVIRRIEGCLDWLEQPILADDKLGFREIKKTCDIKLMADESVHNYYDAKLLLTTGGIDFINLKLMKTGGLVQAIRIAGLAEQYGVKCQMGSMLENQIGAAFCAHAFLSHKNIVTAELGAFGWLQECLGSGVGLMRNYITVTDTPGVGITVNPADIGKYLISEDDSLTYRQMKNLTAFTS